MYRIIYIAGDGRSGSTLLELVISNESNTISIGEAYRFWKRYYEGDSNCGCGNQISNCEFWNAIHEELCTIDGYEPDLIWDQIQFLLKFKNRHRIQKYLTGPEYNQLKIVVTKFYLKVYELTGVGNIIDGSKSTGWLRILNVLLPEKMEIIHLERNLEAVANSWRRKMQLPEYSNKRVWMPQKSIWLSVKTWLKIKYTMRFYRKKNNYTFLSYEDFVLNPEKFISYLRRRLKLDIDITNLGFPSNHSIGGNPMRNNTESRLEIAVSHNKLNHLNSLQKLCLKSIGVVAKKLL